MEDDPRNVQSDGDEPKTEGLPADDGLDDIPNGPGLDLDGAGAGPLDKGQDWNGQDEGIPEERLPVLDTPGPGLRYALVVLAAALIVALGYWFLRDDKPAPPAPPPDIPLTAEPPVAQAQDEGDDALSELGFGPVEVGLGANAGTAPQGGPPEEILTTRVDPSSTIPGGWNFSPPPEPAMAPEPQPQDPRIADLGPVQTDDEPDPEVTVIEANDSGSLIVAPTAADQPEDGDLPLVSEIMTDQETTPVSSPPGQPIPQIVLANDGASATGLDDGDAADAPGPDEAYENPATSQAREPATPATGPPREQASQATGPPREPATPATGHPREPASPATGPPRESATPATGPPRESATPATGPPREPASPATATGPEPAPSEAISKLWVANLLSTPSQAEADAAWGRLRGQEGTNVLYRYETVVGGTNQHRLRLGFFGDRAAAEAAGAAMAKKAGLGTPWAVQPTVSEERGHNTVKLADLWAVNISSSPSREESDSVWSALERATGALAGLEDRRAPGLAGLSLYRYETVVGETRQFRIRLGFFETDAQAVAAGRELAGAASLAQSRIGQPWAVRPTQDELEANGRK